MKTPIKTEKVAVFTNHSSMGVCRGGGKTGICPHPLELGTKNKKFLQNLKSEAYFR